MHHRIRSTTAFVVVAAGLALVPAGSAGMRVAPPEADAQASMLRVAPPEADALASRPRVAPPEADALAEAALHLRPSTFVA